MARLRAYGTSLVTWQVSASEVVPVLIVYTAGIEANRRSGNIGEVYDTMVAISRRLGLHESEKHSRGY